MRVNGGVRGRERAGKRECKRWRAMGKKEMDPLYGYQALASLDLGLQKMITVCSSKTCLNIAQPHCDTEIQWSKWNKSPSNYFRSHQSVKISLNCSFKVENVPFWYPN